MRKKHEYRIYLRILNKYVTSSPSYIQTGARSNVYAGVQVPTDVLAC